MTLHTAICVRMSTLRDQQLAWLDHIRSSTGITLTELARLAGLTPSTLTRFRSSNDTGHSLTATTVRKLEGASGVPAYETGLRPRLSAVESQELEPFQADAINPHERLLADSIRGRDELALWRVNSDVLGAVGFAPGSVLLVDGTAKPRNGDAVLARRQDPARGTVETMLRVWRAPYLLSAYSTGEPLVPELVDHDRVTISGVVIAGILFRR